jgi:hypothetical protein
MNYGDWSVGFVTLAGREPATRLSPSSHVLGGDDDEGVDIGGDYSISSGLRARHRVQEQGACTFATGGRGNCGAFRGL